MQMYGKFEAVPLNSALLGLVISNIMTPERWKEHGTLTVNLGKEVCRVKMNYLYIS